MFVAGSTTGLVSRCSWAPCAFSAPSWLTRPTCQNSSWYVAAQLGRKYNNWRAGRLVLTSGVEGTGRVRVRRGVDIGRDSVRPYDVVVDGSVRAWLSQKATTEVELAVGRHTVQVRVDAYGSPMLEIDVPADEVATLRTGPNLKGQIPVNVATRPTSIDRNRRNLGGSIQHTHPGTSV